MACNMTVPPSDVDELWTECTHALYTVNQVLESLDVDDGESELVSKWSRRETADSRAANRILKPTDENALGQYEAESIRRTTISYLPSQPLQSSA